MSEPVLSKKEKPNGVVSRRRVLQTAGVVAGTGISAAVLGTTSVRAQQTLDFGEVAVGSSDTRTVSQPNPTDRTLPITSVEITGPDADQFSVVDGGAPFTLQADESRTITIEFAPTSTGQKSASVQVEIAGGTTQTAGQLTGTGASETAAQTGDDSTTEESPSSSEATADESATATTTADTTASEDASSTETAVGESQSSDAESSTEDSATPPAETAGPTSTENEGLSITLMLDFNNNGVLDLQDVMTLIHLLG